MQEEIKSRLKDIPEDSIILTIIPSEHYMDINLFILNHWLTKKPTHKGTYISLNRPFSSLVTTLNSNNIDMERLFFIDCVSKRVKESENCVFLGTEYSLTNLGIALTTLLKKDDFSFVFLDSLNTLSLYNGLESALKFSHFLISQLRDHNKNGIILGIHEDTNKRIVRELSQLCDIVIDLSDKTTFT
ncbi:MAG: hypothetical protein ABIJ18_02355 [archaeon]